MPKRVLVSDLYALDLVTLVWEKLWPPAGKEARVHTGDVVEELDAASAGAAPDIQDGPQARYFHSADAHGDHIYYFGGVSHIDKQGVVNLIHKYLTLDGLSTYTTSFSVTDRISSFTYIKNFQSLAIFEEVAEQRQTAKSTAEDSSRRRGARNGLLCAG